MTARKGSKPTRTKPRTSRSPRSRAVPKKKRIHSKGGWTAALARPVMILAGAGLLVVIGVVLGAMLGTSPPAEPTRPAITAAAPAKPPETPPAPGQRRPYEAEYGPSFVAPQPLPRPDALPGVRSSDAPVTGDGAARTGSPTLSAPPQVSRPALLDQAPVSLPPTAAPGPSPSPSSSAAPAVPPDQVAAIPKLPAPTGDLPWLKNAVPSPVVGGRPMIAIVIDDLGVDRKRTGKISDLPGPLTTAFLSYARDVGVQARAARANGHELLVHVPMEPSVDMDPGEGALLISMTPETVAETLREDLAKFDGYVGINNHMGSRFTEDEPRMRVVISALKDRGLLWLDSRTTARSAGGDLARQMGVPYAERNIFLDNEETLPAIQAQLAEVEKTARKHGYAIAIGHPHDATIEALSRWLPSLERKGLVLVPLSAIVRARQGNG